MENSTLEILSDKMSKVYEPSQSPRAQPTKIYDRKLGWIVHCQFILQDVSSLLEKIIHVCFFFLSFFFFSKFQLIWRERDGM
jgi:hypothetical protein